MCSSTIRTILSKPVRSLLIYELQIKNLCEKSNSKSIDFKIVAFAQSIPSLMLHNFLK